MRPPVKRISANRRVNGLIKMMKSRTERNINMADQMTDDDLNEIYRNEIQLEFGYAIVLNDLSVFRASNVSWMGKYEIEKYYNYRKMVVRDYAIENFRQEFKENGGGEFVEEYNHVEDSLSKTPFPKLLPEFQFMNRDD